VDSFLDDEREWLEADGLGGFASGTVSGARTRRYHGLLLVATTPPTGRMMLVNGFDAWVTTPAGRVALTTQRYAPDVIYPDGAARLVAFDHRPWPTWTFAAAPDVVVTQEILARPGQPGVLVRWTAEGSGRDVELEVRPFLSGRDYHGLHRENGSFAFGAEERGATIVWHAYDGVPPVISASNGQYRHAPDWYRHFLYREEQARGLDAIEDVASPGVLTWRLDDAPASWMVGTSSSGPPLDSAAAVSARADEWRRSERSRRAAFPGPLEAAADAYLVQRGRGRTIVAGYPWFTDWGRDTFIALRGLCLATGRLADARDILLEWSGAVSDGMLPNRFADAGEKPEFNAVDASLWFVIGAHELRAATASHPEVLSGAQWDILRGAIGAILEGYAGGTRYGIRADEDGLLAAGEPGVQLTWMDAKVGDWVVTPRIGKPVEVQALWINALRIGAEWSPRWEALCRRAQASFGARFWNDEAGCLYDVVDVDHVAGTADAAIRPNQVFAAGGLPFPLVEGDRARAIVEVLETRLLTPVGLRSLAPGSPGYVPHYEGGVRERDGSYHQGTVWPWLVGAFIEAWLRAGGDTAERRAEARARFVEPLVAHLGEAGLGHVSEIADAEPPHTPRGCPFQAWSLGELIRIERTLGHVESGFSRI
jgi:predicted glycogen debranching enzyme